MPLLVLWSPIPLFGLFLYNKLFESGRLLTGKNATKNDERGDKSVHKTGLLILSTSRRTGRGK